MVMGASLHAGSPFLYAVALLEAVYAPARIHQLLFAGIEGMAFGADVNSELLFGGTGLKRFTADAADDGGPVFGMDVLLQGGHLTRASFSGPWRATMIR